MPKPKAIDVPVQTIKDTFELLKVINGKDQVPLWELAKELGVNKVPLYIYMAEYPGLFIIGEYIKKKDRRTRNDSFTENLTNEAYSVTTTEENKGIHVFDIFLNERENPKNPGYVEYMKAKHLKYIFIVPWMHPETKDVYLLIERDSQFAEHDKYYKYSQWRNTRGKLLQLSTLIKLAPAIFHGEHDAIEIDNAYRLMPGDIKRIQNLGWETNIDEKDEPK